MGRSIRSGEEIQQYVNITGFQPHGKTNMFDTLLEEELSSTFNDD